MLSRINTAAVYGLDALAVSVETDITRGLPGFYIVGLADVTVKEARERIRSAVLNSECEFPMERIVINIAPADIRKKGELSRFAHGDRHTCGHASNNDR